MPKVGISLYPIVEGKEGDLVALLSQIHESFPIRSKQIEEELKLSGPGVRALVSELRTKGYPVGSNGDGYFWATSPEELETTFEHLQRRLLRLQSVLAGLEKARAEMIRARTERNLFKRPLPRPRVTLNQSTLPL